MLVVRISNMLAFSAGIGRLVFGAVHGEIKSLILVNGLYHLLSYLNIDKSL